MSVLLYRLFAETVFIFKFFKLRSIFRSFIKIWILPSLSSFELLLISTKDQRWLGSLWYGVFFSRSICCFPIGWMEYCKYFAFRKIYTIDTGRTADSHKMLQKIVTEFLTENQNRSITMEDKWLSKHFFTICKNSVRHTAFVWQ
jgi:hypothetical protein